MGGGSSKSERKENAFTEDEGTTKARTSEFKSLASSLSNRSAEEILTILGADPNLQKTLVTITEEEWEKLKLENKVLGDLATNQAKYMATIKNQQEQYRSTVNDQALYGSTIEDQQGPTMKDQQRSTIRDQQGQFESTIQDQTLHGSTMNDQQVSTTKNKQSSTIKDQQTKDINMFLSYMREKYGNEEKTEIKVTEIPVPDLKQDYKYPNNLLTNTYNPVEDYAAVESQRLPQNFDMAQNREIVTNPAYFNTGVMHQNMMGIPHNLSMPGMAQNMGILQQSTSQNNIRPNQIVGPNMIPYRNIGLNLGSNTYMGPINNNIGQNIGLLNDMHQNMGPFDDIGQNMRQRQEMVQNTAGPYSNMGQNTAGPYSNMGEYQNTGDIQMPQFRKRDMSLSGGQSRPHTPHNVGGFPMERSVHGSNSRPDTPHNMDGTQASNSEHYRAGQPLKIHQKSNHHMSDNNSSSYQRGRQNQSDFQRNTPRKHYERTSDFQNKRSFEFENVRETTDHEVFRNTGAIPRNNYRGRYPRNSTYRGRGAGQDFGRRYEDEGRRRHVSTESRSKFSEHNEDFKVGTSSRNENGKPPFRKETETKYKEYDVDTKPKFDKFQRGGYHRGRGMARNFTQSTDNLLENANLRERNQREGYRGANRSRGNKSQSQTRQKNEKFTSQGKNDLECIGAKDYIDSLGKPLNANNNKKELKNINLNTPNMEKSFKNDLKILNDLKNDDDKEEESDIKKEKAEDDVTKAAAKKIKNARKNAKRREKKSQKEAEKLKGEENTENKTEENNSENEQVCDDNLSPEAKYLKSCHDYIQTRLQLVSQNKLYTEKPNTAEEKCDFKIREKISSEEIAQIMPSHWTVRNTFEQHHLKVPITNENDPEYVYVAGEFHKSVRHQMKIEMISRIENPMLWAMFLLKKEEITKSFGYEPEERLLFHGTHVDNLDSIFDNNFNWRKGNVTRLKFGQGVVFTPLASNASHHCKGWQGLKCVIAAKVLVAKDKIGKPDSVIPPRGFDTTKRPDGKIIIKFEDSTFYPMYLISFSGKMFDAPKHKKINATEVHE